MQRTTLLAAAVAIVLLPACGSPENEGFPRKPSELPPQQTNAVERRWQLLAKELKIDDGSKGGDFEAFTKRLGTLPGWLASENQAAYEAKLNALALTYAGEAYKHQCRKIVSVTEVGKAKTRGADGKFADLAITDAIPGQTLGATVYVVKYLLQKDKEGNAEAEANARAGLLVVPDMPTAVASSPAVKAQFPIVAYSHGGDKGLGYSEVAGLFGPLQANHIIVAPAFPGEPLCVNGASLLTGSCDSAGKYAEATKVESMPFVNDVDDLLGLHDCIVRASYAFPQPTIDAQTDAAAKDTMTLLKAASLELPEYESKGSKLVTQALGTYVASFSKRYAKSGTAISVDPSPFQPVSYIVGSSRGGLTAQLALARTGGQLSVVSGIIEAIKAELVKAVTAEVTAEVQAGTVAPADAQTTVATRVAARLPAAVAANAPAKRTAIFGVTYVTPAKFQCHADLFGPTTFLATQFRIGLEAFVKGYGEKTNFIRLPGAKYLNEKLSAYGRGKPVDPAAGKTSYTDKELAKNAADAIWRMDVPLQAPFVHAALQNWKYLGETNNTTDTDAAKANRNNAQGTMLTLHGDFDKLVPVEQSKVGATVFYGANASLVAAKRIPGLVHQSIGFTPLPKYLTKGADGKLALKPVDPDTKGFLIDHGDAAFLTSKPTSDLTQCASLPEALRASCKERSAKLAEKYDFAGKDSTYEDTPKGVLENWLKTECEARQL